MATENTRAYDPTLVWGRLIILLVLITTAELLTTFTPPQFGMVLHGLVLLFLFALAARVSRPDETRFLLALSLAPLIRLMSLALPLTLFPFSFWYMVVGTPLLLTAWLVARLCGLSRGQVGLGKVDWSAQLLLGLTGFALGFVEYLILRPEPLVAEFSLAQVLPVAFTLLVFTGFLEEYIFRGVMQHTASRWIGSVGIFYISAVFAVLHIGYRSLLDVIFVFLVALFFAWAARESRSIVGVTLAHGVTNITLFLVFPFLLP